MSYVWLSTAYLLALYRLPNFFKEDVADVREFEGVFCHADNVLVYGQNRQEHDQR